MSDFAQLHAFKRNVSVYCHSTWHDNMWLSWQKHFSGSMSPWIFVQMLIVFILISSSDNRVIEPLVEISAKCHASLRLLCPYSQVRFNLFVYTRFIDTFRCDCCTHTHTQTDQTLLSDTMFGMLIAWHAFYKNRFIEIMLYLEPLLPCHCFVLFQKTGEKKRPQRLWQPNPWIEPCHKKTCLRGWPGKTQANLLCYRLEILNLASIYIYCTI